MAAERPETRIMRAPMQRLVADTRAALNSEGELIGDPSTTTPPRFELFSAASSICSQKVRTILAHHRQTYRSHMLGCEQTGTKLADRHTGSTSVASGGGCDAAVVPTLVDWDAGTVVVDSKRICRHLDEAAVADGARSLRPAHLAGAIDAELEIIDNLPNYQMLSGKPPGEDRRPTGQRGKNGVDFAMGKVERCDRYLAEFAYDEELVRGYMGADIFWKDGKRPAVAAYAARLRELPAVQVAVVQWPGALFN